jgi:hypothetical protein
MEDERRKKKENSLSCTIPYEVQKQRSGFSRNRRCLTFPVLFRSCVSRISLHLTVLAMIAYGK